MCVCFLLLFTFMYGSNIFMYWMLKCKIGKDYKFRVNAFLNFESRNTNSDKGVTDCPIRFLYKSTIDHLIGILVRLLLIVLFNESDCPILKKK